MKRIAILTSGGDAPGMNAAIRAATMLGLSEGLEVHGVMMGYRGLVDDELRVLQAADVAGIIREGGTILGSARLPEFAERSVRDRARENLARRGIEGLIVIGGNGSLTGMGALIHPDECPPGSLAAIGLPGSIDNDLGFTRLSIGVDTAMNTIVDACDKISDTATAHDRTFIVEVMGRDCGYLAMTAAIASAAECVLFPEMDKSEEEIAEIVTRTILKVRARQGRSKRVLVIKAEGVAVSNDRLKELVDARIRAELGEKARGAESRVTVLGHVVRGGRPSALDRILASRLAHVAVRGLLAGESRKMAAWSPPANLPPEIGVPSRADPQCALVDLDAMLAETKRLLDHSSPFVKWRQRVFQELENVLSL
ncbi:ATP-dependent 6-phosphofructokinase [Myxococcota bacterium]|nr:ATP-dependent 6-phosphofructokinase [Myxococcota bacterium]